MSTFVMTNASITIGGVDLSDHCMAVSISYEAETVDDTNMGDTTRLMLGGLLNYGVEIELSQDYAAGEVDATMFPLVGTAVAVVIKATSAAVGTTNPSFSANMLLQTYPPLGGAVGEKATTTASFVPAGTLVRATS
jgi:hypothetical protein